MTKKVVNFFAEEKCTPRENPGSAYEKRAPALRWYGGPRMVNPAMNNGLVEIKIILTVDIFKN